MNASSHPHQGFFGRLGLLALLAGLIPLARGTDEPGQAWQTAAPEQPPAIEAPVAIREDQQPLVYVIPIIDAIEPALLYVVRRGVREAQAHQADALIVRMDTPGGTLDAASRIVRLLQSVGETIPTMTFVENGAYSAGAIIALATHEIYMAPGSVIGDAMPMLMSPLGGVQEMPEDVQEKMVSAVAAQIRATAEQSGHNTEVAEAMVRREIEFKIGDEVISPAGQLLTLTSVEAERRYGEEERALLSAGTVRSLEELLEHKGLGDARVIELRVTAVERIARFIAAIAPLLLIVGLLGVYMEIRTPGFGLPGMVGAACLVVFFWGHHVAGLAGREELLFFVIGAILLLVELFFIPDFGLTGALGLLLMLGALLSAMIEQLPGVPWYRPHPQDIQHALWVLAFALAGCLGGGLLLARFMPSLPVLNRLILAKATTGTEGFIASTPHHDLLGRTGPTLTALRPAGTMRIDDKRVGVVTRGEFIERGAPVRVTEVHGNRIIVEPHHGTGD